MGVPLFAAASFHVRQSNELKRHSEINFEGRKAQRDLVKLPVLELKNYEGRYRPISI
jgi:hypothetical protein